MTDLRRSGSRLFKSLFRRSSSNSSSLPAANEDEATTLSPSLPSSHSPPVASTGSWITTRDKDPTRSTKGAGQKNEGVDPATVDTYAIDDVRRARSDPSPITQRTEIVGSSPHSASAAELIGRSLSNPGTPAAKISKPSRDSVFWEDTEQPVAHVKVASKRHAEVLQHIRDPDGCFYFRKFMRKRHCEENLAFFLEVEKLHIIDPTTMVDVCERIYREYIKNDGTREVNLSAPVIDALDAAIASRSGSPTLFDDAQLETLELMVQNCWNDYVNSSSEYKEFSAASAEAKADMLFAVDSWNVGSDTCDSDPFGLGAPTQSKAAQRLAGVMK